MSKALEVNGENFEQEVLKSEIPVLVDFWAPWCGPCQMMSPILDEIASDLKGKLKIAKVNVDEPQNQQIAANYDIMSIPNMKLFKSGQVQKEFVGAREKESFKQELQNSL